MQSEPHDPTTLDSVFVNKAPNKEREDKGSMVQRPMRKFEMAKLKFKVVE